MNIQISRGNVAEWQKKGALAFCFEVKGKDGVIVEQGGDYVWPMPMWEEYEEEIKGTFGDVANIGKTRWGDAITAAVFLKQFVGDDYLWAHLDIAPRMTALPDEFLSKGSAGASVRLLVKLLEKF